MTTSANAYKRRALGLRGADAVRPGAISDMAPNLGGRSTPKRPQSKTARPSHGLGGLICVMLGASRWLLPLAWNSCAANPPMNCGDVYTVLLTELGGEIPLFRCYENVVAGDDGWQEKR